MLDILEKRTPRKFPVVYLSAIIALAAFLACEGPTEPVVMPKLSDLSAPDYVLIQPAAFIDLSTSAEDPQGQDDIAAVYFTVLLADQTEPDTFNMLDNGIQPDDVGGDGIYSFRFQLDTLAGETGGYLFTFGAADIDDNTAAPIRKTIVFYSDSVPVIYDLIAPDSLLKGSPDTFAIYLSAWDQQGLSDIDSVFFTVIRPDSSTSGNRFHLHDDGEFGDAHQGDGVYTLWIQAPAPTDQTGDYLFTFVAYDQALNQSNVIVKVVTAHEGSLPSGIKSGTSGIIAESGIFE